MKKRLVYLGKFYVLTVLIFVAAKVVFMLCNCAGHDFGVADVLSVIGHGLTLDLSTALYFLIVPFLLMVASVWVRVPRWVFRAYYAIVAVAFALAFVADTSLYAFWQFKLDASWLGYLETPTEAFASVSVGYLLVRLVVFLFTAAGIYYSFRSVGVKEWRSVDDRPLKAKLAASLASLLMVPLMVVGIRGGVGESTTNIGQVYYSQNQFLNHSAVNPVFSFLYSAGHQLDDLAQYEFFEREECERLVTNVYTTESVLSDTLLNTTRPDIVIILMESAGEQFAQAMPHLQQLKQEGIYFSHCYANSWRTDRGTVATLSGYPSFPTVSVMKIPEKSRTLPSIAKTLQGEGYETSYLYGGDINFTNMRSYLISTGWSRLTSMSDYSREEQHSAQWGVRDDITFRTLLDAITHHPTPATHHPSPATHHLWGYSTLSSHEPWDVPTKTIEGDEVENAFAYLDNCLHDFVGQLKASPQWANLLLVLVADHGILHKDIDQQKPLQKNHIPMLWIGGAVRQPRVVETLCNQSDLAATLLGQLGLPHDEYTFSRDVLSESYVYPTALNNYSNAQWLVDSTGHVLYDFDVQRTIVGESRDAERLLRVSKAILQTTTNDLENR